jgi:hypothetical protein
MSNPNKAALDVQQVLAGAFDSVEERLRVDAEVTATLGTVECVINAASGDDIAISDGTNTLSVNPDGSINVIPTNFDTICYYSEITNINTGLTATIINFSPSASVKLQAINVSGDNIATYKVIKNSSVVEKKRTYFGNSLNLTFEYNNFVINNGDSLQVDVIHNRPYVGNFNATIKYIEI